ncbi:hypothetical protein AYI68_g4606, partial [Smittium mucronatum]
MYSFKNSNDAAILWIKMGILSQTFRTKESDQLKSQASRTESES